MSCKTGICDVQFVVGNGHEYFAKELAFCNLFSESVEQIVFGPPYEKRLLDAKYKKQNAYNKGKINGLDWNDGDSDSVGVEYSELKKHLTRIFKGSKLIFVKGLEKQKFLKENGPEDLVYVDLECLNCPPLKVLCLSSKYESVCKTVSHTNMKFANNCACKNVFKLRKYVSELCTRQTL